MAKLMKKIDPGLMKLRKKARVHKIGPRKEAARQRTKTPLMEPYRDA